MVLFDLRNRINNEAVWEDKRINQKVFEKEQQQVATMGMSEMPPNDKLQAIAYQFNKDVENVKSALQNGLTQLDPSNPFADFSQVSLAWNKLVARINPYIKGNQQSATLTLPTAGDYAFVRQTLYDGLYSFTTNAIQQIKSWKKDLEDIGDVPEAQGEKAVEDIRNQVMTGFYKTVAYGSEKKSSIDPNRLPSNTTSGSTSLGQSGIATPLGLRQAVQQGFSQQGSQQGSQQSTQPSTQPSTNPSSGALTPQQQGQPAGAVAQPAVAQLNPKDIQAFQGQVATHGEDIPLLPENARDLARRMENDYFNDVLTQLEQRQITQDQRDAEVDRLEAIMPDLLLQAGYGGQPVAPPQALPQLSAGDRQSFEEYEASEGRIPSDADPDMVGQAIAEFEFDKLGQQEKEDAERDAQQRGTNVADEITAIGMDYALLVPSYLASRPKRPKLKLKIDPRLGNIFQQGQQAVAQQAPAERQLDITPLRKGKGSKEKNDKLIRQFIADEGIEPQLRGWGQMSQAQRATAKPVVERLAKKFATTPKFMNSWLSENRIVGNGADMEGSGFFSSMLGDMAGSAIRSGVGNVWDSFKSGNLANDALGLLKKGVAVAKTLKEVSGNGRASAPRGRPLRLADVFDGNSAIRPNSLADLKNRYRGNEYIGDSTGAIIPNLMNRGVLGSGACCADCAKGKSCSGGARCCFNSSFCKGTEHYKRDKPDNWVPSKRPTAQGVKQRRRDWNVLVQAPANARPLVWKKTPVVIQEQGHRRKRRSDAGRPRRPRGAGAEEGMVGGGENVAVNVKYASLPKALQPTPEDLMPKAKPSSGGARQRRPRLPQQSYQGYHDEENDAQKVYENMSGLGRQQESEMMKTEMLQDRALGLLKGLPRRLGVEDPKYKNKK